MIVRGYRSVAEREISIGDNVVVCILRQKQDDEDNTQYMLWNGGDALPLEETLNAHTSLFICHLLDRPSEFGEVPSLPY